MRNVWKIMLSCAISMLLFIAISAILTASVKNVYKIILVEKFKSKGIYQEDISNDEIKFFKIDSNEELSTYITYNNTIIPGNVGDILITSQAELGGPIIRGFIGFFAGGHAALCTGNYSDFETDLDEYSSIEATGLSDGENVAEPFLRDYWSTSDPYTEVIGLRVKMTEKERNEVISVGSSYLGDKYNYSFLFDTVNKSYCSDLIAKTFSQIGVNLNKDGFTTSVYDLLVSSDSYISYYHYIKDDVKYIYYLG